MQSRQAGAEIADLCRKCGMGDACYYSWKARYIGMTVSDLRRLKALEAENRRLKLVLAEQALDSLTLKELLQENL